MNKLQSSKEFTLNHLLSLKPVLLKLERLSEREAKKKKYILGIDSVTFLFILHSDEFHSFLL